jgi:dihydrofolate reductase
MSIERSIVLYIASSLDGYIAGENGELDWLPGATEESSQIEDDCGYSDFYQTVDTVIMGKVTYDQILTFGEFPYPDKKCYVFSTKEKGSTEYVEFVNEDVLSFVQKLKQQNGSKIWLVGGADMIESFMKVHAIDEFIIMVIPTILGKGIPLFKKGTSTLTLSLKKLTQYGDMVSLHYQVK